MSNFFRKDLNLDKKRGHRLLAVMFFGLFVYGIFSIGKSFLFERGFRPIFEVQSSLNERITSEVKSSKELSNPSEVLYSYAEGANIFLFLFYGEKKYQGLVKENYTNQDNTLNKLFCSNQLYRQIDEVTKRTGISQFYIKEINNFLEPVPKIIAIDYMKKNNVNCLSIDGFGDENKFLNPGWVAQEYQNNYFFYKQTGVSNLLTIISLITGIITIIALLTIPFGLLIIIYYKIVLYIIYGKKKNGI